MEPEDLCPGMRVSIHGDDRVPDGTEGVIVGVCFDDPCWDSGMALVRIEGPRCARRREFLFEAWQLEPVQSHAW